jgi:poly-gamma-glutamate capsule biosynthesis protein CapA/YwtB (metallophosphatase superfamily)
MTFRLKTLLKWFFLLCFLVFFILIGSSFFFKPRVIEVQKLPAQISAEEEKVFTIILVGDIMLNRGIEYMVEKYGGGDFKFPFQKIAEELKKGDILFGNLEGPISDKGVKVGSIYSFRADPKVIEGLTFAGFDIISLANNHAFDYGKEALEDNFLRLGKAKINYLGAGFTKEEAFSPIIKEVNETKVAFLAYTNLGPETWRAGTNYPGIAWVKESDFEKIREDIESAKATSDILIVSLHAGEEYQKEPTQFQIDFAKMAIEAGADLAVGHHPHIVQRSEQYKNGWIFYSLGNFVFDQNFSEETIRGQLLEVLIENKKIKEINPKEIKINNYFQPEISEKKPLPQVHPPTNKLE